MKYIYVKSLNILFLFFNKSGSSLYTNFIENWLKWLKIDYEYMDVLTARKYNPKVYMMVRNPLERLVTSFYWTKTFDIQSKFNKFPIDEFIKFIDELETEMDNSMDMHLLPQTWQMVEEIKRTNIGKTSKLIYKEFAEFDYANFYPELNIKIIQLEGFQRNFQALRGMCTSLMFYPYYQKFDEKIPTNVYYEKSIGQFTELNDLMDSYQKLYVVFLYNFVETAFQTNNHHNNLYEDMIAKLRKQPNTIDVLVKANSYIANESKYLGYKNDHYLNKNKFTA
jgi:hypothetical protein